MKHEFRIIVIRDSHGNEVAAACTDPSETVQFCGLKGADGEETLYFENEAYHAASWAKNVNEGLTYIEAKGCVEVLWGGKGTFICIGQEDA